MLKYAVAALSLLGSASLSKAAEIVVFGDSWGSYGLTPFANEMKKHGITVDNVAVSGSTAKDWAEDPNYLRDTVRKNPDAKFVWLVIGGNDAKNNLPLGKSIDQVIIETTQYTQAFLDPLFEDNKDIRVVQFGYDILTFEKGICPLLGQLVFSHCRGNVTCVNTDFIRLQNEYVPGLSKIYDRHDTVNLLGTLQKAGGVPNADITQPNLDYYSPSNLMLSNCIHPNPEGFTYIFEEFWKIYFESKFNEIRKNQDSDLHPFFKEKHNLGACAEGQVSCEYLPGTFQCCLAGENCIKNVGCRC